MTVPPDSDSIHVADSLVLPDEASRPTNEKRGAIRVAVKQVATSNLGIAHVDEV